MIDDNFAKYKGNKQMIPNTSSSPMKESMGSSETLTSALGKGRKYSLCTENEHRKYSKSVFTLHVSFSVIKRDACPFKVSFITFLIKAQFIHSKIYRYILCL